MPVCITAKRVSLTDSHNIHSYLVHAACLVSTIENSTCNATLEYRIVDTAVTWQALAAIMNWRHILFWCFFLLCRCSAHPFGRCEFYTRVHCFMSSSYRCQHTVAFNGNTHYQINPNDYNKTHWHLSLSLPLAAEDAYLSRLLVRSDFWSSIMIPCNSY